MSNSSRHILIIVLALLLTMTIAQAEELDSHLYGVAIIPTDVISGFPESTLAALERQTNLRFRQFHCGDFSHGLDLQTWAPEYIKDVEPGRQRELTRLLHAKPSFVLEFKFGKAGEPVWLQEGLSAYVKDGGVLITDLPKGTADSPLRDEAHLWARAVEEQFYAKCGKPLPTVRIMLPATIRAGETMKAMMEPSSLCTGKATLSLADQADVIRMSMPVHLSPGSRAEVLLPLSADLPDGQYHLSVQSAASARELGCSYLSITQPLLLKLTDDGIRHNQNEMAEMTATLTMPKEVSKPGDFTLKWILRDYRRGVIAYKEEAVTVKPGMSLQRTYQVPLLDTDPRAWIYWLQAVVEQRGVKVTETEQRVYRWRPFTMREQLLFGTWHVASGERPTALRPLVVDYLKSFGMRSTSEGGELFQRAGFRATLENGAMTNVRFQGNAGIEKMEEAFREGGKGYWARTIDSPAYAIWSLGEETGYYGEWSEAYPWRDKEEAPVEAALWFRQYLQMRYQTIETLNQSWGTAFKAWTEVKYQRKYAYPYGWLFVAPATGVEKNLAPYVDTHAFAEWWVHELVTNNVAGLHEKNPVPLWTKSFEFTFVDWCTAPMTHFCCATDPHGTALWNAYVRGKTPGAPPCYHLNWGFYDDPRQTDQFWLLGVLSGATYIDNWGETMNWDLTYTRAGMRVRDLAQQLKPAANLFLQAYPENDIRVGIFLEDTPWKLSHGRPGYYLKGRAANAQTYGPTIQSPPGASWLSSAEGPLYAALCSAGYAPRFITRNEIAKAKIIFLPYTEALSQESARQLKDFVNQGGTLVALPRLADYDEGGHPYDVHPGAGMRELFGATVGDDWIGRNAYVPLPGRNDAKRIWAELFQPGVIITPEQEAQILSFDLSYSFGGQPVRLVSNAHMPMTPVAADVKVLSRYEDTQPALTFRKVGKGTAIFLNVFREWPNLLHIPTDENDNAFARVLHTLTEYAGVTPDSWFETLDSNGQYAAQLVPFRYTGAKSVVRLVGLYNDWRSADAETRFIVNTPVQAVYDVLTGERLPLRMHLGHPCTLVNVPRGEGRMLAVLPYEVMGVHLTPTRAQIEAGEPVRITATLTVSAGTADIHPAHLTVFAPDGQAVPDADRDILLDGSPIILPTYLDLAPGVYHIAVRDCVTRVTGNCSIRITTTHVKLPAEKPFGWPSWRQRNIDIGTAEFEQSLKVLSALYQEEDADSTIAYSIYVMERDRSRHRIDQLLAQADWRQHLDVLQRLMVQGKHLLLVGEDLGLDPATGQPAYPLTTPTQFAALDQLAAKARIFRIRGITDVVALQLNKGWIVLDRRSPDREAGTGPTRMTAWITRWRTQMQNAGLLPGNTPDQAMLLPISGSFILRDWFMGEL